MNASAAKKTSTGKAHPEWGHRIIPNGDAECVWAGAGVVPYKLCDHDFNCGECPFDLVMRGGGDDLIPTCLNIRGCKFCPSSFYHRCHTWSRVEENANVRIGLDDLAYHLLGGIRALTLPAPGAKVSGELLRIEGRGGRFSVITPFDGQVVAVNGEALEHPESASAYPYGRGWLVLVQPSRLSRNLKSLAYGAAAREWFEGEMGRLQTVLAETLGLGCDEVGATSQDGGVLHFDILNHLRPKTVRRILLQFLH